MKKLIWCFTFLLISSVAFAQTITIKELVKSNEMKYSEFDHFITNKGYAYSKTKNKGQKGIAIYSWLETAKGQSLRWFVKETHSMLQNTVKFQTMKAKEFTELKDQAIEAGFEFNSNEKLSGGAQRTIHTKGSVHLVFTTYPGSRSDSYEVEVQTFK